MNRIEHPTADEWAERQRNLPPGAVAALAAVAAGRRRADEEAHEKWAEERRRADAWRSEFEATVAAVLVECGAEWLVPFRVPDHECAGLPPWDSTAVVYAAHFDPFGVGLWPVRLTLTATANCGGWFRASQPWTVFRPRGPASLSSFGAALEVAAEHCAAPF